MYKLGIDVGGTNTDAVLIDENRAVVADIKYPTSADIYDGILGAMRTVLEVSGVDPAQIHQAMLGTTQCTNAIVERKNLAPIGILRIGAPATTGIRPNNIRGLMSDATKWLSYDDMYYGNDLAKRQFQQLQENGLYVDRLTLTFDNDIGIGFFKGTTIPTKTRRARFLFDKLGNLLANYPILK